MGQENVIKSRFLLSMVIAPSLEAQLTQLLTNPYTLLVFLLCTWQAEAWLIFKLVGGRKEQATSVKSLNFLLILVSLQKKNG
jgi:hypothetical protein